MISFKFFIINQGREPCGSTPPPPRRQEAAPPSPVPAAPTRAAPRPAAVRGAAGPARPGPCPFQCPCPFLCPCPFQFPAPFPAPRGLAPAACSARKVFSCAPAGRRGEESTGYGLGLCSFLLGGGHRAACCPLSPYCPLLCGVEAGLCECTRCLWVSPE